MSWDFAVTAIVAVFAIVNPIGNIPVFVAITDGYTAEQKRRTIIRTCFVAGSVLFGFGIFGQWIFQVYGITIPAFKIAGGVLLFSIAFSMTRGQVSNTKMNQDEHAEAVDKEEVGVVPLGIPLFAGPGAITTVMIYISYALAAPDPVFDVISVFIAILITIGISYILLKYADPLFSKMGKSGANAFTRIMGLLLAAMAIEFILSGTFGAIEEFWHIYPL
jgi:multiple antibiotic resistance protein